MCIKDNPGNSGKIKKEIDVVSIKRDGLTKPTQLLKMDLLLVIIIR